jgi:hypothetical protein
LPRPLREKLEDWGKIAWVPILIVASLSFLVGFCNYRLQISGDRPYLVFTNGDVDEPHYFLRLYWLNSGKLVAWRGRTRLYALDDAGKRGKQPLEEADIIGAGVKVFPGYGGQSEHHFAEKVPQRFLACITYSNEDGSQIYEQGFLLSVRSKENMFVVLDEAPPNNRNCH